jgi:hypothetical protein
MPIVVTSTTGSPVAITDYDTLQSALANWLHRANLDAVIPDLILFGENRIYRDLRVRQMETALNSTIASGVIAVPTGYVELKNAYVSGSPAQALQRKDAEFIYANYPTRSSQGKPKFIAREATNLIFGPYPDSAYTIKGVYYKKLDPLSASNTTNWLITDAPDLILFASLCEAAAYIQEDERLPLWERKYAQIAQRVQENDDQEEFSGSPISMSAR